MQINLEECAQWKGSTELEHTMQGDNGSEIYNGRTQWKSKLEMEHLLTFVVFRINHF